VNVFSQYLDAHEAALPWAHAEQPPESRLLKFDAWARSQLAARIDWAWAGPHKERRIEQARVYLERMVLDLWRRGWMLDGRRLAARITTMLDVVGSYQRAGKVRDFWPYFRATVDRYVGLNSEELQAEALRAGAAVGQALNAILKHAGAVRGPSLPELVAQRAQEVAEAKAESLRERQARVRARRKADAQQQHLL
jgi:hypothetical protein